MRDAGRAKRALGMAEAAGDEIGRTLWLARAAGHGLSGKAILVGGAAVNLHTGSYRPTDVDMCAYLDEADRASLKGLGFTHDQGDHFRFTFDDGEEWFIEFPDTEVDGTAIQIDLGSGELLDVISLESLIIDRLIQATDGTGVTFNEALRLVTATLDRADWETVRADATLRETNREVSGLDEMLQRVLDQAQSLRQNPSAPGPGQWEHR